MFAALQNAIDWRRQNGLFQQTEALRIFYGPGESNDPHLKHIAIDLFRDQAWVTLWAHVSDSFLVALKNTLTELSTPGFGKIQAAVLMDRSKVASDANAIPFFGDPSTDPFLIDEFGAKYTIQMANTKHPGLFLDHAPLRKWLLETQKDLRVLNLFSYTGSLSVAAGLGGAKHVTTLDLSKTTVDWASQNWRANNLSPDRGDFIYGDVFEWLPKFAKRGERFDTVLSDPPSFSRSKSGTFSTQKDLPKLHALLFSVMNPGGILMTSINSENISEAAFLNEVEAGAKKANVRFQILKRVDLPESFPTLPSLKDRYLKGFYLRTF